jgi:hypothetical protein
MSYIRLSPTEYRAIARVAAGLGAVPRLHALKRLLVTALADTQPALAARIGRLKSRHLRVLHEHLWGRPRRFRQGGLTAEEVGTLEEAFGPLLLHSRFRRPLKRALVRQLLVECPALADKLHALSPEQFDDFCEQLRQRMKGDSC